MVISHWRAYATQNASVRALMFFCRNQKVIHNICIWITINLSRWTVWSWNDYFTSMDLYLTKCKCETIYVLLDIIWTRTCTNTHILSYVGLLFHLNEHPQVQMQLQDYKCAYKGPNSLFMPLNLRFNQWMSIKVKWSWTSTGQ